MKHTFYAPQDAISGGTIVFPETEAHHAIRVLRVRTGDEVAVVDGNGNWYAVTVEILGRRHIVGKISENRVGTGEPVYDLTVAIGMIKNTARFEVFLEKAVELGVRKIIPLITKRAEKSRLKQKRSDTILLSALKQSGRSRRVELTEPVKFKRWLKEMRQEDEVLNLICHEKAPTEQGLASVLRGEARNRVLRIAIGPEGGFEDEELSDANAARFRVVSLSPRRLRTETAGIVAAATVMNHFMQE